MTLEELEQVHNSLLECGPDVEDFSWGPTYEFAMQRRETALKILKREIEGKRPKKGKYPCEPVPFQTMYGDVMICGKCGHYALPECK